MANARRPPVDKTGTDPSGTAPQPVRESAALSDRSTPEARLRLALDLSHAAEIIMRKNLERRFPEENHLEINERLRQWYHERPGAQHGDGAGRVRRGKKG